MKPLLSIITPSLNCVAFIREAIESVLHQDYPYVEHLIVDGGSTDGTLDAIRTYSHLRLVTEPDAGLYEALNKGIGLAKGELIGWLNGDDLYEANIFAKVAETFLENPHIRVVSGGVAFFEEDRDGTRGLLSQYTSSKFFRASFTTLGRGLIFPNPCFYQKKLYEEIGLYDVSYRYGADLDFLIRLCLSATPQTHLPQVLYYYRQHSLSLTVNRSPHPQRFFAVLDEHLSMMDRYIHQLPFLPKVCCIIFYVRRARQGWTHARRFKNFQTAKAYKRKMGRFWIWWPLVLPAIVIGKLSRLWYGRVHL